MVKARLLRILWICIGTAAISDAASIRTANQRRIPFNDDWKFSKGEAPGAESPSFADAGWRPVRVPHDWAIEAAFDARNGLNEAGLPAFGTGWYRKHFTLEAHAQDRRFRLEFDGAMANSTVWLNGQQIGGRPYGYIGFSVELTPHLRPPGEENVLAVRLAPEPYSSRWYSGAGIYRSVWLEVTGPVHVARWGVIVTTPQVSSSRATVAVRTQLRNESPQPAAITLESQVLDQAGRIVGRAAADHIVGAGSGTSGDARIELAAPKLWAPGTPYLYRLVTLVRRGSQVLDRQVTSFGVRTIEFTRARGFQLNGQTIRLQGVNLHHSLGAFGAAFERRAAERQLEIMRQAGVNAIRTAHNPPAPELLELCDRMGLLVIDEAFDMWRQNRVPNGYGKHFDQWSEPDIRDMVRRDRNHPSIILWSIGNETPEGGRPDGWQMARRLAGFVREEDGTRPVTMSLDKPASLVNQFADQVDIPGLNYMAFAYDRILREHPNWVIYGSESGAAVSTRGVYHLPLENYARPPGQQVSSYDVVSPYFGYPPDVEFEGLAKSPEAIGEFVWSGFDYLGEGTPFGAVRPETPGGVPSFARTSYYGMVDIAGFPKDRYYLYQSMWTQAPMAHILPHWNWPGREGQPIPVMVYTNAEEVELFLNGESLGRKKRFGEPVTLPVGTKVSIDRKFQSRFRLMWQVPYQPGRLRAVALRGGSQVAVKEVRTAGAPARIVLTPDRKRIAADGEDLLFVTARIEDKDGAPCPLADNPIQFRVEGAGIVAAVDNGNPLYLERFQTDRLPAFNGLALLMVRSRAGQSGPIRITAESAGLSGGQTTVTTGR